MDHDVCGLSVATDGGPPNPGFWACLDLTFAWFTRMDELSALRPRQTAQSALSHRSSGRPPSGAQPWAHESLAVAPQGHAGTRWIQVVVATRPMWVVRRNWSRASAGVLQPRVFRGLLLRAIATAARSSALCTLRSVPFGKYWRSSPLVFSFVPRCQGLCGSQK